MKECAACNQELSKDNFSKKQYKLKQNERRCKDCVAANQPIGAQKKNDLSCDVVDSNAMSKLSVDDGIRISGDNLPPPQSQHDSTAAAAAGPSCWICLCDGPDENGQIPRRDCSCRGIDSGYAHLSCLVEYAKQKTNGMVMKNEFGVGLSGPPNVPVSIVYVCVYGIACIYHLSFFFCIWYCFVYNIVIVY